MAWTAPRTWVVGEIATAAMLNEQIRDNLNAVGLWTAYTPSFTVTGGGLGNGTATGRWAQVGDLVVGALKITFGTTSTYGSAATFYATLPSAPTQSAHYERPIGYGYITDAGVATYPADAWMGSSTAGSTTVSFARRGAAGYCSNLVPFTWASTDVIAILFAYEPA